MPIASSCGFLTQLYYGGLNLSFIREHRAVLAGRLQYRKNLTTAAESSVLLRRNIHRLEKGIIMRPRRSVFAADYIGETAEAYRLVAECKLSGCESRDRVEEKWAFDVLSEYFSITDESNSRINKARAFFRKLPSYSGDDEKKSKPYCRNLDQPVPVAYDSLLKLAEFRRSVRWFRQETVDRNLIDRAVAVAGYSPSACNRQPFHFRVFDDPQKVQEVIRIPMGTVGFSHNVPGVIAVVGSLDAYFDERDRHVIYIDSSLASMSLIYALETQGVSSCSINWPDMPSHEKRMAKTLGLKPYERVIMLIAFGYPDPEGMVPFSQKKPLGQLRSYN
jgi:nitroreductase